MHDSAERFSYTAREWRAREERKRTLPGRWMRRKMIADIFGLVIDDETKIELLTSFMDIPVLSLIEMQNSSSDRRRKG